MNRRLFLCSAASGLLALSGRSPAGQAPSIALILKSMKNEFFVLMAEGARRHHARRTADYTLTVDGVQEETDTRGQEVLIHKALTRRADVLIIVPADSTTMVPPLLKAMAAGVLVINMDNKLDDRTLAGAGVNIPFVGPSNFMGARSVAEYVARQLKPGSKAGLIEGAPGSINAKARSDGFREALRAADIAVAGMRWGYWDTLRGKQAALELIDAAPGLAALLCGNDNMAIGAAQAVQSRNLTGKILIGGYDNIPAIRPLLASRKVIATADQHPELQAAYAIDLALNAVRQRLLQPDMPSIVQTPVQLVTKA
ncbi:substrate-binding domain-containing protein [Paludibacterium paludis]|uniref:Ribose ABC transporter substrate-binding protein n=1 Tax=Paludibacterium paludis TaxID=1225769 RepID=A0A918P3W1_9NEIS|nr:substrate-binding domain-containing protein [Paludibacterium paludis]GGY18279.1 ribose ABC transporter substrate-binding protein [Paludibacterium paludis]